MVGARAAPRREPACWKPWPNARLSTGSQRTSAREPAGKDAASPAPSRNRVTASEIGLKVSPIAAVNADHHARDPASTARAPNRSDIHPPGTWKSAYAKLNAEAAQPIVILLMWNSCM